MSGLGSGNLHSSSPKLDSVTGGQRTTLGNSNLQCGPCQFSSLNRKKSWLDLKRSLTVLSNSRGVIGLFFPIKTVPNLQETA